MFKRRRSIGDIVFNRKLLTVLGLVIILAVSYPLAKNLSKQYKINSEIENLKNEIKEIENKKSDLSKLMDFLETDQYVDKQARLNLNLKKEGEEVVVIKNKEEALSGQNAITETGAGRDLAAIDKKSHEANLIRWYRYFIKANDSN